MLKHGLYYYITFVVFKCSFWWTWACFCRTCKDKYYKKSFWYHCYPFFHCLKFQKDYISIANPQWSKWPKLVSIHYWRIPRGGRGVKKSVKPNWSPFWWVGAPRFSCEKQSKLKKKCQLNPVFWRFFEFHSIWTES